MGTFAGLPLLEFLLRFVLVGIGVYRLVHAFTLETGPFAIFANLREAVIRHYAGQKEPWQVEFIQCPLCQGFWAALVGALIFFPVVSALDTIIIWWALSGMILILHLLIYR